MISAASRPNPTEFLSHAASENSITSNLIVAQCLSGCVNLTGKCRFEDNISIVLFSRPRHLYKTGVFLNSI